MSSREAILGALMTLLTSSVRSTFTGTASYGSAIIADIASTTGLFPGMPISSERTPSGAVIQSIDSDTQITLSVPADTAGAHVAFITGWRTTGRRVHLWTEVAEQPALFLRNQQDIVSSRPTRMPGKTTLECEAWIYSNAGGDPTAVPAVTLNYLIEAIETVLKPSPGLEVQTLGGLVTHCWIEGAIEKHTGDLDGQAIAVVPINILCPTIL